MDGRSRSGKRNSTACEHCRSAKAKCQPSEQPGVCKKCLAAKRECIYRTQARPQRARLTSSSNVPGAEPPLRQSPSQPTTFTIETFVPVGSHRDDGYHTLREMHASTFDTALDDEYFLDEIPALSQSTSPSISSSQPRTAADIWRKPQFNAASAQTLLETFDGMLKNLPFINVCSGSTVPQLASTQPLALLAILTVTSGLSSVQTHSLYDDEFLKVLGLKYVSGGDSSLELLQALLIYCAWYPFHLKPKTSQLGRCMRMASEIVHDLGLDENFLVADPWQHAVARDELDKLRIYVAYVYIVSTYIVVWKGDRFLSTRQPGWAATAVDILERNAQSDADRSLATVARLSNLFSNAANTINDRETETTQNSQLILLGLWQQLRHVRDSIITRSPDIYNEPSVRMQLIFLDIYLHVGSMVAFPASKTALSAKNARFLPPTTKMMSTTKHLRAFLDLVSELDDNAVMAFTVNDWSRFIVVLTLAYRLSFPVALRPGFDWAWANNEIQLGQFLAKVTGDEGTAATRATATTSNGILAANRAVLSVLHSKFIHRLNSLSGSSPESEGSKGISGCPVMRGSGGVTIEQWDTGHGEVSMQPLDQDMPDMLPILHDILSAEGGGWHDLDKIAWDSFGGQFGGDTVRWPI